MIKVTNHIFLPEQELGWHFMCASGPGGQHVNKTATAVQLRFNIKTTTALPDHVKTRLIQIVGNRMNNEGELVIAGRRYRSQKQNRDDVLAKLLHFIRLAASPPKPRKKTKVPRSSKEKRLTNKHKKSAIKRLRQQRDD